MRILRVNKFYPPHIGGIETVIAQRAKSLSQFPGNEVKVLVCQEKGRGMTEIINGVEIIRCGSIGTYFSCPVSFSFFREFRKLSQWADIIEFHTPFPLRRCGLSALRVQMPCRDFLAQRCYQAEKAPDALQTHPEKFLRRADCIITATQGHIDSSAFLPEFREKCRVIPYPVELSDYLHFTTRPLLTEKLTDKHHVKVLFVGRLVYYKGADILLKAFRNVRNCELFLCGTGILEPELKKLAGQLPVHFLGSLSDDDLKSAFADCDIFVLPSVENAEAFGIVQQEAMIYGKPVINTSLPTGVPYVSLHQKTGLTVPPRNIPALTNAIQKLADSPELRVQYGRNARKRVLEQYDSNVIMQEIEELFRDFIIKYRKD